MEKTKLDILHGCSDETNALSIFKEKGRDVLTLIFDDVEKWYKDHVHEDSKAYYIIKCRFYDPIVSPFPKVIFPTPQDININMMPIKLFDQSSIPELYHPYLPIIYQCPNLRYKYINGQHIDMIDKIVYLTIHESLVPVGQTQRRPGLHIERPGALEEGGRLVVKPPYFCEEDIEYNSLSWGLGNWGDNHPIDGIYMASNISDSCTVWPVVIENPHEVTDAHGGMDHMAPYIGPGHSLKAGELCWITDRTPHKSNPIVSDDPEVKFVYRQFFRLVVGKISVWYSKHNTPNPLGILPDAPISDADKFEN